MRSIALLVLVLSLPTLAAAESRPWIERADAKPKVAIPSAAPLVREVEPAVLSIYVEAKGIDMDDPRIELFRGFGMRIPDFSRKGEGTGFIIHPDGYALTNNHVVENASKIQVRVGASKELVSAVVVGTDPRTDVALIKLDGGRKDWPALPLGDSDALQVGDFVIAVGNPFGLSQSVSMGIVSAKSRRDIAPSGRRGLYDFIQTDASINPGNSGGPLVNLAGEVVGINAAVNAAGQGLGFAIPINMAKRIVPELKDKGRAERAYIGVKVQDVQPGLAKALGLASSEGALVAQVVDGSPGFKAGLKPGDVITRFNGKAVDDSSDLPLLAADAGVGATIALELVRDGERRSAKVTLAAMPDDGSGARGAPSAPPDQAEQSTGKLGIKIDTLTDELRARLELPAKVKGAVIVQLDEQGAAAEAGLQRGDVVTEVNGQKTGDAAALAKALDKIPSGKLIKLLVLRDGATTFVALLKP
ncbi:MAG: trypsin-like peptidase domain-containing protein [Deltaproteobacteria bacterium]|nr:trypsin-like peptidase domain-containing protein [Deltaproteobacteria bacterium]